MRARESDEELSKINYYIPVVYRFLGSLKHSVRAMYTVATARSPREMFMMLLYLRSHHYN